MRTNVSRRRGTSIAAAALSLALVAPLAQPVAAPHLAAHAAAAEKGAFEDKPDAAWLGDGNADWNKTAQGKGWSPDPADANAWRHVYWVPGDKRGDTQPELKPDGSYNVDAIASGQVQSVFDLQAFAGKGYDVISGRAVVVTPRFGGQLQTTYSGYEPLSNEIPVYMQWMDRDGAISPVYSATTNNSFGNGRYAFAVPQWIDGLGRKHRFMGQTGQKYRVWVEPTNDPETGNELMPLRTAPGMVPHAFGRGSTEGLGEFNGQWGTNGNIQHTGVFMYERAHKQGEADNNYMKAAGPAATLSDENRDPNAKLIHDDLGPRKNAGAHYDDTYYRTVAGKVWIENGNERQLFTAASPAYNESPEKFGVKARVFATALTDEGADAYDAFMENVDVMEQSDKTKQWIADNPEYVAGTVYGEPDAEGEYTLRFPDDVFGNEYNVFTADKFQQHLYMWVEVQNADGNWVVEPSLSTFTQPVFQDPRNNNQWNPTPASVVNNAANVKHRYSRLHNVNMALVQSNDVTIDITNYNNTNHYAERGQTAEVVVKGALPVGAKLQWRDGRGNVQKECEITDPTQLNGCETFEVPMDAADGSFYYAAINNGYNDIAIDSFLVRVLGPLWSDTRATPNRDIVIRPNEGKDNLPHFGEIEDGVSPRIVAKKLTEAKNEDGTPKLNPQGNPIVEETVLGEGQYTAVLNEKGELSFTPNFDPKSGEKYKLEVYGGYQGVDENNQPEVKPRLGEDGQPELNEQGVPQTDPVYRERFIDDATITYWGENDSFQPEYETSVYKFPASGSWKRAEIPVRFIGEDGDAVDVSKVPLARKNPFVINSVPDGWTIKSNTVGMGPGDVHIGDRGRITYIPWDNDGQAGYEQVLRNEGPVELPVTVTYADGTQEQVKAVIIFAVDDTDQFDVKYGETDVAPGETNVLDPAIVQKDGKQLQTVPGSKFAITETLPDDASDEDKAAFEQFQKALQQGYKVTIDETTGIITVTGPEASKLDKDTVEQFKIPVTVTYPDGTSEQAQSGTVYLDTDKDGVRDIDDTDDDGDGVPDTQEIADKTNPKNPEDFKYSSKFTPAYQETAGPAGATAIVDAPTFTVTVGGETKEEFPQGSRFTTTKDGAEIDETSGAIIFEVPKDAAHDSVVEIPVTVTYPDKSTDEVTAKVKVSNIASLNEPQGKDATVDQQSEPKAEDFIQNKDDLPEGTTYEWVQAPDTTTGGDKPSTVKVTYPDGTTDEVEVKVTVKNDADTFEPKGKDIEVQKDTTPNAADVIENKTELPSDTTYEWVTTPDTSSTGEKPAQVRVTYPDGTSEPVDVKVKVKHSIPAATLAPASPIASSTGPTTTIPAATLEPATPTTSAPVIVPIVISVEGEPKTVKPTNDEQGTGLTVKNPNEGTEVTAKDEDGKDIKVSIDPETGEIKVTPGENVDGPITVTVTDPNLPNGKYEVDVPVEGHEKGRNDNATTVDTENVKPVDPTNEEQPTGIIIDNEDDETEVSGTDEDKNDVTVTVDPETGEVKVTPGKDADGPITVIITDPDLPNGEIEVTVPVNGHEENRDDNNSGKQTTGTTEVDAENVKPVKPTDEEQPTGIVVKEKDGDTKVSAKDEDGQDITVTIDEQTGEIKVVPGENVDGPITVTITDPDLPNGSVEVKVPVEGHEEGRNDNGTKVNTDNVTPVEATGKEQGTGIVVKNPDGDTKVTAKDEDGNDVTVTIDEKTGEIKVIPGENVDGPITVTITDPDLPNGEITVEVPVNGHEKNRDDNGSHTSTSTTPDVPADGKEHVVGRIDNPTKDGGYTGTLVDKDGNEIEGSKVVIDPETGEIKVTVPSGTTPGEATVVIKDKNGKTVKDEDGNDLTINIVSPSYGEVSTHVKPGEKGTTKDPFEGQKVTKPFDKVEVTAPGNAGDWAFTIDGDGKITGTAPTEKQLQDSFTKTFPNGTTSWEDFKEQFAGIGTPTVTGSITLKGGTDPVTGEATFELIGQDGKSIFNPDGDFDGDGVSNAEEIKRGLNPFNKDTDGDGFEDGEEIKEGTDPKDPNSKPTKNTNTGEDKDTTAPTVDTVREGDKTITGTGRPGETVTVTLPNGTTLTTTVGEDGKWTIELGQNTVKVGDKLTIADGDGNTTTVTVEKAQTQTGLTDDERNRCIAAGIGFGLPLLALIPLGIALTTGIPGLDAQVAQFEASIERANTNLQKQLGIFNPQMAAQAAEVNAQLKEFGLNLVTGAGVLLLIPLIIGNALGIASACTPGDMSSLGSSK